MALMAVTNIFLVAFEVHVNSFSFFRFKFIFLRSPFFVQVF